MSETERWTELLMLEGLLMKSVCITIDDLDFRGGAHIATASLLRALQARGVIVDVLTSTGDVLVKLGVVAFVKPFILARHIDGGRDMLPVELLHL